MERSGLKRLVIGCLLYISWNAADGQAVPQVPFDVEFAGVTVHINEEARLLIQQEVNSMYVNRTALLHDLETLRQLTPLLEARLTEDRLPADFRYAALPFPDQTAYGYWGLTIVDAGKLKLRIDPSVDERLHAILATDAVVDRLADLQLLSGNYAQTLLQYLQGVAPTDRKPASKYATYLLLTEKNPPLLWKILARKFVVEREEPTFRPSQVYVLFDYPNGSGQTLASIARQLTLSETRFEPFNQWLKTTVIPPDKRYPVLVRVTAEEFPQAKSAARSQASVNKELPADVGFPMLVKRPQESVGMYSSAIYYTINGLRGVQAQPCDNAITLAYYGDRRVETFIDDNDLTSQDVIHPGQIYYLDKKARRAKVPFHVVQRGQTLREISNMYGVQLKSLLKFNRIPANQRVQTGRIIWLQRKRPKRRPVEYQLMPESSVPYEPSADVPVLTQQDAATVPTPDTLSNRPADKPSVAGNRPVSTNISTRTTSDPITRSALPTSTQGAPTPAKPVLPGAKRPVKSNQGTTRVPEPIRRDTAQAESREVVRLHIIKPGQTYYSVARQYGVAIGQLYAWNNLSERYPLEVGQEIIVSVVKVPASMTPPPPSVSAPIKPVATSKPTTMSAPVSTVGQEPFYYTVQPGQTAYRVALINKVPVEELARWNNLKNYTVVVGQRLIIRKK